METIKEILPVIIVVSVVGIIKILDMLSQRIEKKINLEIQERLIDLMDETASHATFKNIAAESLQQNSPQRDQGDYLDFFIQHIPTENTNIANKLLKQEDM